MRIAAIDIGTNSLHMIVVRVRPDLSFEVIDREKEMVRLGAGGLDGRALTPEAMHTALQVLSKFRRLADSHRVDERRRMTFHPAYLVDDVEWMPAVQSQRRRCELINRGHVNAVLADARLSRTFDVRHDAFLTGERDGAKSAALAAFTQLLRVEAGGTKRRRQALDNTANDGRLANAWWSREEQRVGAL